ncbi:MAG TPA: VOC family protein [Caulobacteraceae bacterium]|jgi:catechol 2,3-dioxygenase-like lactoylglutathione lyase family enzyme
MKKRAGDPWIPASKYGALLPQFMVNLIVRDVGLSLEFYRQVLGAHVHYSDPDFAAIRVLGAEMMLHGDHTYEGNPWSDSLRNGVARGLGAELRLLGVNPDEVAERARARNALFKEVAVRGHGWREVMVRDPDGYVWAVGEIHPATR